MEATPTATAVEAAATATAVEATPTAHSNPTPSVTTAAVAVATTPVNHPAAVEIVGRVEPKPERTEEHALAR